MTSQNSSRLFLSPPCMLGGERELLLDAFDSNWIAPNGPHIERFETEACDLLGKKFAVALSSGTAALHLALAVLEVGKGDSVATASFTFVATANAIRYVQADPIFIDSDNSSWNIDPELLRIAIQKEAKAKNKPKAVVVVDAIGQSAAYEEIETICNEFEIPLIEDAAEAFGATYQNKKVGSFGNISCLSFNGNKIVTTGGGGMIVTDDEGLAARAKHLATQACEPAAHYEHSEIGYNYRMSNLLAAVGRGQLKHLDTHVNRRRAIFDRYYQALKDLPGIGFMPEIPEGRSTRWLSVITIDSSLFGASREDVRLALEAENIESRPAWKPMHLQPVFADCKMYGGKVCEMIFDQGLCLPSGTNLSEDQQDRVTAVIQACSK
ncbi:aminotransferase class I/II-fold pyridoxal phosphate-dependent enzyme [bacterium]|nr:aminotransferase class I/II-fold pyridoxal phosphate-dependent enzyme [bacterium]